MFEKIDNIGNLLQNIEEKNKAREEEIFPALKNENNKVEQNENNSVQSNNLEEMKVALKLKIENKIKNNNDNKNINEETKVEKRREEKRREEKRKFIKGVALQIQRDKNKNGSSHVNNLLRKDYEKSIEKEKIYFNNHNERKLFTSDNTIIIICIIIITLIPTINNTESNFWNITIRIKVSGTKKIFSSHFFNNNINNNFPNKIFINEVENSERNYMYFLGQTDNIIKLQWNDNNINNCSHMFYSCYDITEIDLSNFDSSKVKNMSYMFYDCQQLSSLNLHNFNTSNVINMDSMFYRCYKLSSLNLSNFETSKVIDMNNMFFGCKQLFSLDLSNFDTSKVTNMERMFSACEQLFSLDLSNFDTSNVTNMNSMFSSCSELSSLNLSNFDTSKVTDMNFMFNFCSKLGYINLKNFIEINNNLQVYSIFDNLPGNAVICLNENSNKIKGEIKQENCFILDCSDNWERNQKKLVNKMDLCFDYSNNSILYNYEYKGLYYENCINGNLINNKTINYCKCDYEKCISCSDISVIGNFYEIENDDNLNEYKKCYKEPIGYYLDINEYIYKKCYYSCEKCEIKGNNITHNCIKCNKDNPVEVKVNNYSNCYQNNILDYSDIYDNYNYSNNSIYPSEYLTSEVNEFQKHDEIKKIIENLINNKTNKEEKKYYDTILKTIEDIFTSKIYNTSKLDNGNDEIIETEKVKVILTTTENQKNNINSNMTSIDLGECENSLRQSYNLSDNETVYIKMFEISQEGMRIPKIEYDIYSKLDGEKLIKLNLTSCKNNKISLFIPVDNVDNLDKLNSKSGYYNDVCYTATSDNGTDITLEDRKNEYASKTVCQDDCDFVNYNYTSKKAKCSCIPKQSSSSFADMKIDINRLLDNFKNIKNIANLNLLKCVKVLFSKIGILENVGFYIFNVFIIFHTTTLILFYLKKLNLLINNIKDMISAKIYLKSKKGDEKGKKEEEEKIEEKIEKNEDILQIHFKQKNEKKIVKNRIRFNDNNIINVGDNKIVNEMGKDAKKIKIKKKIKKKKKKKKGGKVKNEKENDIKNNNNDNIININFNNNIITDGNDKKEYENAIQKVDIKKLESMMDYTEEEINDLSYDLALKNDKRSYWQYYVSLIRTKHELLYAFFYNKDYNSKIIKIDLFIFGFGFNYAVNGLFFNDSTMHNVYESKGSFDVAYQLPIIVYSSFISMFLGALVQMLGLSNDSIVDFKQDKETNNINESGAKLIKKLKIKFVLYFILSFILLLFFWYYISMFDAVYRNTQFLLLKDTLMGFGLSLISPFVIYLFPGLFRIPALASPQ